MTILGLQAAGTTVADLHLPAPAGEAFRVRLVRIEPAGMALTSSVQGLAYTYATRDDLNGYVLRAGGEEHVGDRAIRDWCCEHIPRLLATVCEMASEGDEGWHAFVARMRKGLDRLDRLSGSRSPGRGVAR